MTDKSDPFGDGQDKPNVARMYDYFLGGFHNFAADREAAQRAIAIYPEIPRVMRANRAFLRRAMRFLLEQGVEQFLDVGAGIPTAGNVHEIAQEANPAARVVSVDSDAVAVGLSARLLAGNANAAAIRADAREPEAILGHPEVRRLLDLGRPVGLLLVALLHFLPDDAEAERAVRALRDAVAPGSYLVLSHATSDDMPPDVREQMTTLYSQASNPAVARSRARIARFFAGFEIVEPGLVAAPLWRPVGEDDTFRDRPERAVSTAGVGRKP
jgi:hypothetical protein